MATTVSPVANANRLALARGRIEATGTHAELLRAPIYRELIEHELAPH